MALEISVSRRMFQRDIPPITGERIANTTRANCASRIGNEHIGHGSTLV